MELTIGSCRIRMDFGFPAMLALLFLQADTSILRQAFAVSLLHECGHALAMLMTGAGLSEIRFQAAGMQLRTNNPLLSQSEELLVLYSGPAVNLFSAGILYMTDHTGMMVFLHLGMGLFNLLPFRVLDGGAALQCLLEGCPSLLRSMRYINLLLSAGLVLLLISCHVRNPSLYLMLGYLCIMELWIDKKEGL